MMKELRRLMVIVPAVALLVLLVFLFVTRGAMEQLAFLQRGQGPSTGLVDQRPYQTAHTLTGLAISTEERELAQEAERLADHEVDQAFAMALRLASVEGRVLTGRAAALAQRVETLKGMVRDDKARVDALETTARTSAIASIEGDDLDVAKAQVQLDTDELTDATEDLARESGDKRGQIQQELATREAAMKKTESQADEGRGEAALTASSRYQTLWWRANAWFAQRSRAKLIAQARLQVEDDRRALTKRHAELEGRSEAVANGAGYADAAGGARVKLLERMATRRVVMSIVDDRVETEQQMAAVYEKWEKQVWLQHRIVGHLLLESLAWVSLIVLAASLAGVLGRMLLTRLATDARRSRTLETILTFGVEGLGAIGVLLVVFGVPQQMPTILGLATAGLTVVLRDFILAFFGWFVLMGKNGIRVNDWVEINGVAGEVAEIGLFRTALLETGNWTSRGHPTGRRVTFINSFAITGQYFNFSTKGQWMWDQMNLNVPATANAYELCERMQRVVEKETAKDAAQAELEWQRVTEQNGLGQFSAKATVDLRPAASGVDVLVRFMTRANERFEVRSRLYLAMLGMMEGTERPALAAATLEK